MTQDILPNPTDITIPRPYKEWSELPAVGSPDFLMTQALSELRRLNQTPGWRSRTVSLGITDLENAMLRLGYDIGE